MVPMIGLEWRTSGSGDGSRVISGHNAVFNQRTTLYDGTYYRWTEALAPSAFARVLASKPDVHFDIGHDLNRAMARTLAPGPIGKLELEVDDVGLRMYARLNPGDPDVVALASKMDLGIMDQGSFMFNVTAAGVRTVSSYDDSGKLIEDDTIIDICELRDVCICAQGAYPTTQLSLRTNLRMGAHVFSREVPGTDAGAPLVVASQTNGAPLAVGRDLAALRAKARIAAHTFQTKEQSK
jgi:HK97 family phage prohead protease